MASEIRHPVKFALTSLLGPLAAIGLIFATMAITFLTIESLYTNPSVWVCFGVLFLLFSLYLGLAFIISIRLNPFEYDSEYIYSRKGLLKTGILQTSFRAMDEILYSQNLLQQITGSGTIVLKAKDKEQLLCKLRGVANVESTAGALEKLRLAMQQASR